ncbi:MAG: hypothetical protein GEV11_13330 [Streptosporangiales bacterium]|nr:hypothetical protein [Streptosporangiales bacterium]
MDATTLASFLAVDLLLVFTPGADWAYAIAAGLRGRSVPAVAGLVAGYAGYTLLAVAGLVVIVANSATVLTTLTVAGACYLVWLGWGVMRRPASVTASEGAVGSPPPAPGETPTARSPRPGAARPATSRRWLPSAAYPCTRQPSLDTEAWQSFRCSGGPETAA